MNTINQIVQPNEMREISDAELHVTEGGIGTFIEALIILIAGIGAYSSAKEAGGDIGTALSNMEIPVDHQSAEYMLNMPAGVQ